MIDDKTYLDVLDSGLLLDHYFILCNIKNGRKLLNTRRIKGFVNLLTKKGYLEDEQLTEKGYDLVENCGFAEPVSVIETTTEHQGRLEIDFGTWVNELHKKCQEKLYTLMKIRQVRTRVPGEKKMYSFLPNATDLGKVLHKVIKLYKLKDFEAIEKAIMSHIDNCAASQDWFPLLHYWIGKTKSGVFMSDMVTYMDGGNEQSPDGYKSNQKLI